MKRTITKEEQLHINRLLKRRREKQVEKLFPVNRDRERLWLYDEENFTHKDGTLGIDVHTETLKRTRQ